MTTGLRFEIEHGGTNDVPDVEYASVAFWYQTPTQTRFPPLPQNLLPLASAPTAPAIEAESLLSEARVTGGRVLAQDRTGFEGTPEGGAWGGGAHLWWVEAEPGDRLTLPLRVDRAGDYDLFGFFTRAGDYGIVRLTVNGRPLQPLVDGYNRGVVPTGAVAFGAVPMRAGENEVVVELLGKDERPADYSNGHLVGIDGFLVRPVTP